MAFGYNSDQLDAVHRRTDEIFDFLQQMAMAQQKRIDDLCNRIDRLNAEIAQLKNMSTAVPAPQPAVQQPEPAVEKPNENPAPSVVAAPAPAVDETPVASQPAVVAASIPPIYFGAPEGTAFSAIDTLPSRDDSRALYVLEPTSATQARFYPIAERLHRLRSNATSYLFTLCNVEGDLDNASTFEVSPASYGRLTLVDGYWELESKCNITLI